MNPMEDKLDSLWGEYREAIPDPEPSAQFMPQLWQRIDASRNVMASRLLRRWAEVWLLATVALAVAMGAFLIPRLQVPPASQASYLDVLSAADSANDVAVIPVSEAE
jgi:hypothetical protein